MRHISALRPTIVAVDEYHKVASRDPAGEDPVERVIAKGGTRECTS